MTSLEEIQKVEEKYMSRKMDKWGHAKEGYEPIEGFKAAKGAVKRFLNGRHPLPRHDFTEEEILRTYENVMNNLENVGEEYDREFVSEGFPFENEQGDEKRASTWDELTDIDAEGYTSLEPYNRAAPVETTDGQIEGYVEYSPSKLYRGTKYTGGLTVKLFADPEVSENEQQDLEDAIDEALEEPIRL